MRRLAPALIAAVAAASCSSDGAPAAPPGSSPTPPAAVTRLAWSQAAPSQSALNGYSFVLFVDGSRMPLAGVSCTAAAADFDCSAPLPSLSAGAHLLAMAAVDNTTGQESHRSESIMFNGSAPRAVASAGVTEPEASSHGPWLTCAAGDASTCFVVSALATGLPAIERMATLPDNRVVAVFAGGVVQILPGGQQQRLDIDRGRAVNVVAIAVDPEFLSNRFVYVATLAPSRDGGRAVSVVRLREVAGSLGEAATIAADLPAAQGPLAMSVGPDGRIYLALPSAGGQRSRGGAYDGLVLRLTREGSASGYEPMKSPVLAVGSSGPASFAWLDGERLLLASSQISSGTAAGLVPLGVEEGWPAHLTPLTAGSSRLSFPVQEMAAIPAAVGDLDSTLFVLGLDPAALYLARLTRSPRTGVRTIAAIPLGAWTPSALALDTAGNALVAARRADETGVSLLRVRAR